MREHLTDILPNQLIKLFLRKWFGATTAKKIDEPLDSRQSQEPTTSVEAMILN
jgi:hypothetical protein